LIIPAIKQAGLTLHSGESEGSQVNGITFDLIRQVAEADIVVIDANCYETHGAFTLSPYLFYLLALRHTLGNQTILVAAAFDRFPAILQRDHALTYVENEPAVFYEQFESTIRAIEAQTSGDTDNPIQDYLRRKAEQEEQSRARQELQSQAAQVDKTRRETQGHREPPGRIEFRPVR
jgi:hypothetical protein